jgi:thioredoxin 1
MDLVTGIELKEKIAQGTSVVTFTKKVCPFCKTMKKVVAKLEDSRNDLIFLEIDENENQESANELDVKRLPTILFFKDGEARGRFSGVGNLGKLNEILNGIN